MKLNFTGTDLCAVNGTRSKAEAHYGVVVIGAGPSGIATAIEAAKAGAAVLLVDENPVSGALMGNDVPLYFGGRMTAAVQNSERMLEAVFMSLPALEAAIEAGVEVRAAPQGSAELVAKLAAARISVHCGATIASAQGGINGVEAAALSSGETIACDTICAAVGLIPSIELVDAMHGPRELDGKRGGYVPRGEANVSAVGLCAGLADSGFDHVEYRMDWIRALAASSAPETIICQCEEVTRADLLGVQPPNYLNRPPAMCARSLGTLLNDGPANPDQIKRLTRAGMGVCQGRRCRDQVAMLLALESGQPFAAIPLASHRAPVRPLPMKILADWNEPAQMEAAWDVWFGIPTQWVPVEDIGTPFEDEHRGMLYTGMYE